MSKAKAQCTIDYAGSPLQLYPDLLWVTLQKRRHVKPLLLLLTDNGISYRWGFPFALLASKNGCTAVLHTFDDLPSFFGYTLGRYDGLGS